MMLSQTEKDKYCMISYIESKKKKKKPKPNKTHRRKRPDLCLPEVEGGMEGDLEESGQKLQTSSYKINK